MKWFLISLLLLLLWIIFGGFFIAEPLCAENHPPVPAITDVIPASVDNSFSVSADGSTIGVAKNGFYFPKNSDEPVLDTEMESLLSAVSDYLKEHPGSQLSLIGDFDTGESNNSGYPDLGVARAVALQELLLAKGVDTKQLLVSGVDATPVTWTDNKLYNGVSFSINKVEINEYSEEELAKSMEKTQYIYFKTAKQSVLISPELQTYFEQVKAYTLAHPEAQIVLTGHTDNTGNLDGNIRLGRKRAEFIESYLKEVGVKVKIAATSEGPDAPIADNATDEGRAKNRRVEMKVIK